MHLWLLALSGHFKVTRQTDKLPPFCSCCTMVWPERFWREMVVGVRCWVLIVCLNGRLVRRVRFYEVKPQANVTLQNSLQHLLGKKVPKKVQHQKRWGQYHGFTDSAKSLRAQLRVQCRTEVEQSVTWFRDVRFRLRPSRYTRHTELSPCEGPPTAVYAMMLHHMCGLQLYSKHNNQGREGWLILRHKFRGGGNNDWRASMPYFIFNVIKKRMLKVSYKCLCIVTGTFVRL